MRSWAILFVTAVLLCGCSHTEAQKNVKALKLVQIGDTKKMVDDQMGSPDIMEEISKQRFVAYYQTKKKPSPETPVVKALCTPVAFENGLVAAVGGDIRDRWVREEEERLRRMKIEEARRQAEKEATLARERQAAERRNKIEELEKAVAPIPAYNVASNLKLYRQLLQLDPENPKYQKKVSYYEARLVEQNERREARAAKAEKEKLRKAWEESRPDRNERLRQYTGNGIAKMAVHDMGDGSLYVWVKNVSNQIITTHPDYFTLLDGDDEPMSCEISDSLDSVLEPGSLSHGKITYDDSIIPKELIFQNREAGRISKSFQ